MIEHAARRETGGGADGPVAVEPGARVAIGDLQCLRCGGTMTITRTDDRDRGVVARAQRIAGVDIGGASGSDVLPVRVTTPAISGPVKTRW